MKSNLLVAFTGMVFIFATAPARGAAPIDGTGTVGTCPAVAQAKIKSALVNGGTDASTLKTKIKPTKGFVGPCPGATGDGANVISAKSTGTGTGTNNDCNVVLGTLFSNTVLTVKWKTAPGAPKLNPSTVTFTTQGGGIPITPNHGQFNLSGTVTAGSFVGDTVTATLVTDLELDELLAACDTTTGGKGIKKLSFGKKPSKEDQLLGSVSVTIQ